MCNLYSLTKGQAAIIALARAMRDTTGNLPPMPGIFPDYLAPIVRSAPGWRARARDGSLGHALPAAVWWRADHQHPQRKEPALEAMVAAGKPMPGAVHILLRVRRHQAAQDAHVVRLRQ